MFYKSDNKIKKEYCGAFSYRYDELNLIFSLISKDNIVKMLFKVFPLEVCKDILELGKTNVNSTTYCHFKLL